ncbi:MAG TPA: DoxX family protein [Polyangiaceae bacterium]|nr:DoxX family protein [Polyangiaceae bacterium]
MRPLIYRVDYLLAIMLAGVIAGAVAGRWTSRREPARLARGYFVFTVAWLAVRLPLFLVVAVFLRNIPITGGIWDFAFGALFGIALRHPRRGAVLREPPVLSALCLSVGVQFIIGAVSSAFAFDSMTEFFTQSGYSVPFLRLIIALEALGGIGLLVPATVPLAIVALGVDMFGAIYTHAHNGDPIHDSSDAIAMLIRLGTIAVLWLLARSTAAPWRALRAAGLVVLVGAVVCTAAAITGGVLARHWARGGAQVLPR